MLGWTGHSVRHCCSGLFSPGIFSRLPAWCDPDLTVSPGCFVAAWKWLVLAPCFYTLRTTPFCNIRLLVLFSTLCSAVVGFAYPGYQSFKALRRTDVLAQQEWLRYWMVLSLMALLSLITDLFRNKIPFYNMMKLAAVVVLVLPNTRLYRKVFAAVEPQLTRYEADIDNSIARASEVTQQQMSATQSRATDLFNQSKAAATKQAQAVKDKAAARKTT